MQVLETDGVLEPDGARELVGVLEMDGARELVPDDVLVFVRVRVTDLDLVLVRVDDFVRVRVRVRVLVLEQVTAMRLPSFVFVKHGTATPSLADFSVSTISPC